MYRQQRAENLRGGRGYTTEVAGRDRVKFFRRPAEPDNTVLENANYNTNTSTRADAMQAQFAASCPSFSMPSHVAAFSSSVPHSGKAERTLRGRSSAHDWRSPQANSTGGIGGNGLGRRGGAGPRRAKPYHLPAIERADAADGINSGGETQQSGRAAASVQTMYRDNEAQTDPYSPDYFIPEGAPTPEILGLQSLTYQNRGLPAGMEGVQLIQRLRRRRDVEASLPTGTDAASIEAKYIILHELEEKEWAEREDHVAQLQQRRLDRLRQSLLAREAAREDANRERLEQIKSQYLESLGGKLMSLEMRRTASSKRGIDKMAQLKALGGGCAPSQAFEAGATLGIPQVTASMKSAAAVMKSGRAKPSIAAYARYGMAGAPPQLEQDGITGGSRVDARLRAARQAFNYDVRPQLLADSERTEAVDAERGVRMDRVAPKTFVVPENEAVKRLPTLYQRREAERVLHSLEYAYSKLHPSEDAEGGKTPELSAQRVLELYRATPKLQRPETPVLKLEGDDEEEKDEACILLQRLLRGRAVQNDFFDGRERCRGLIKELQAASTAQTEQRLTAQRQKEEALEAEREAEAQHIVSSALGSIVHDTLGFLSQELGRQQDMAALRQLQEEAEVVRAIREAAERARRAEVRQKRDRNEVAYAAYMRATDTTLQCFLDDVTLSAVEETAMAVAVEAERARQAACPSPRHPSTEKEAENIVCDMLDGFVIPAIVDAIELQDREVEKKAVAGAALDAAHKLSKESASPHR
ncbi:Cilia- and flagella-associated protein 91, putative [Leishmania lindenbergi]|uniref:Cilia- and flagella-associated protein 91 n=1 Tax=Leishmania lindenbergi TaxID=651832 RepID=A0AAW2ZXU9_9TRYP